MFISSTVEDFIGVFFSPFFECLDCFKIWDQSVDWMKHTLTYNFYLARLKDSGGHRDSRSGRSDHVSAMSVTHGNRRARSGLPRQDQLMNNAIKCSSYNSSYTCRLADILLIFIHVHTSNITFTALWYMHE